MGYDDDIPTGRRRAGRQAQRSQTLIVIGVALMCILLCGILAAIIAIYLFLFVAK